MPGSATTETFWRHGPVRAGRTPAHPPLVDPAASIPRCPQVTCTASGNATVELFADSSCATRAHTHMLDLLRSRMPSTGLGMGQCLSLAKRHGTVLRGCGSAVAAPTAAPTAPDATGALNTRGVGDTQPHSRICDVTDYNATGDGKTFDTAAIEAALRDCSGGGVVVLPGPNTFLTSGGHVLSSNMGLEIQAGAVLLQTPDQGKGSAANQSINCGTASVPIFAGFAPGCAVLSAQNASNVSIYGEGAIRGAGAPGTCWNWIGKPYANLLRFQFVDGLRISGVSLQNPCGWTVHPQNCRNVHIHDIKISCEPVQFHYNTDGIDPDSCVDVLIEDVDYSCGDDAVAIKASWPGCQPSKNITVRRLKSGGRGGFTIGSEVQGGAEDITFEDSVSTGVSGIRISQQLQRGGFLRNILFRNISFNFGNKFVFEKKTFVLMMHQSYAAEDEGKVCPGYNPQPTMTGIHFADLTVVQAPSNLTIGDLGCDRTFPPACTKVSIERLVLLDAPNPQPLTCSSRPGSQCKGNCSSVHGVIAGVSPAKDSRCVFAVQQDLTATRGHSRQPVALKTTDDGGAAETTHGGVNVNVDVVPPAGAVPVNGIAEWALTIENLTTALVLSTAVGGKPPPHKSIWEALNITLDLTPPPGAAPYNATHRGFLYAGSVWKVRAALRSPGQYSYTLRAAWADNGTVIHSSHGTAQCSAAAAAAQNYSVGPRGFLRPRFGRAPFRTAYEDGTLFTGLGLGDCINDQLTFPTYNESDGGQFTRSLGEYVRDYAEAGFNIFRWSNGNCAPRIETSFDGGLGRPAGNVYNETLVLQLDRVFDTFRARGMSMWSARPPLRPKRVLVVCSACSLHAPQVDPGSL